LVFQTKAVAYGLGALLGLGGILLIALGYNQTPTNVDEVAAGCFLVAYAGLMWVIGYDVKESRKRPGRLEAVPATVRA
jgi:drug/metabolite transporter (DMT)-like permease